MSDARAIVVGPGYWARLVQQHVKANQAPTLFGLEARVSKWWPRDWIGWLDRDGKLISVTDLTGGPPDA